MLLPLFHLSRKSLRIFPKHLDNLFRQLCSSHPDAGFLVVGNDHHNLWWLAKAWNYLIYEAISPTVCLSIIRNGNVAKRIPSVLKPLKKCWRKNVVVDFCQCCRFWLYWSKPTTRWHSRLNSFSVLFTIMNYASHYMDAVVQVPRKVWTHDWNFRSLFRLIMVTFCFCLTWIEIRLCSSKNKTFPSLVPILL